MNRNRNSKSLVPLKAVAAFLFTHVLFGCATLPNAKEPCAGIYDHTDDFGRKSRGLILYVDNGFRATGLVAENRELLFRALFALNGVSDVMIPVGAPVQVALANGSVLDFETAKAAPPVAGANEHAVFTQWAVDLRVSPEQADALQASPVTAVKLQFGASELLVRTSGDTGQAMQHLSRCLAGEATDRGSTPVPASGTQI